MILKIIIRVLYLLQKSVCRNTAWIGFCMWQGNIVGKEAASLWASQLFFTGPQFIIKLTPQSTCYRHLLSFLLNCFWYLFTQAHYCLSGCDTSDSYGKKLLLFLKWKCMDAKVGQSTTQFLKLPTWLIYGIDTMLHLVTRQWHITIML